MTLLAWFLIASPLLFWAYVSALSHFTILEPPYTAARGLPLAMQVFFTSAGIVPTCLGVGLLYRSEWSRRIACVVFALLAALAAFGIGGQLVARQQDSNILLGLWTLVVAGGCLAWFLRGSVRAEFRPIAKSRITVQAVPPRDESPPSRPLLTMAWGEIVLGIAAALLLAHLQYGLGSRPLLDVGPGIGVTEADELLRTGLFVAFAFLVAPQLLIVAASIGILVRRETLRVARRYLVIACRALVGAALIAAWLGWREGLSFDFRLVKWTWGYCAIALLWHARFLYILSHYGAAR